MMVRHSCHCGRELHIPVPVVSCPSCRSAQANVVVASVDTCLWDEERRSMLALDSEMRSGKATWGTFAIRN